MQVASVLVVDTDPTTEAAVRAALPGASVESVRSVGEAVRRLRDPVDLVVAEPALRGDPLKVAIAALRQGAPYVQTTDRASMQIVADQILKGCAAAYFDKPATPLKVEAALIDTKRNLKGLLQNPRRFKVALAALRFDTAPLARLMGMDEDKVRSVLLGHLIAELEREGLLEVRRDEVRGAPAAPHRERRHDANVVELPIPSIVQTDPVPFIELAVALLAERFEFIVEDLGFALETCQLNDLVLVLDDGAIADRNTWLCNCEALVDRLSGVEQRLFRDKLNEVAHAAGSLRTIVTNAEDTSYVWAIPYVLLACGHELLRGSVEPMADRRASIAHARRVIRKVSHRPRRRVQTPSRRLAVDGRR